MELVSNVMGIESNYLTDRFYYDKREVFLLGLIKLTSFTKHVLFYTSLLIKFNSYGRGERSRFYFVTLVQTFKVCCETRRLHV
jgi:hypothetical protein